MQTDYPLSVPHFLDANADHADADADEADQHGGGDYVEVGVRRRRLARNF